MGEWIDTTLGKIAEGPQGFVDGPFGSNLPATDYVPQGIPVIRGSNLSMGVLRFIADEFVFVSPETANRLARSEALPDDIIFTKKGTIGQTGIVPSNIIFDRFIISSNQMRLRVNKKSRTRFLFTIMSHKNLVLRRLFEIAKRQVFLKQISLIFAITQYCFLLAMNKTR